MTENVMPELVLTSLPGVWEQHVEPGLYIKTYHEGTAWIEAQLVGEVIHFKAKQAGVLGGIIKAAQQVGPTFEVPRNHRDAIEFAVDTLEKHLV